MTKHTKSSITLPPNELSLVEELMVTLGAKSKVDVIRRGLKLLKESTDRDALRRAYISASDQVRAIAALETSELDLLPDGED